MWKIIVGFIIFAGLAVYLLNKGGDIDLGGEKHGRLKSGAPVSLEGFASDTLRRQARIA